MVSVQEAVALQKREAQKVCREDDFGPIRFVAGTDVSSQGDDFFAAIAILSFPDLSLVEVATAAGKSPFPYISGLLSFRELPIVLEAWEKLQQKPDLVLVDGQGIAHPRRFGIAAHLGVTLDVPAIGCAKTRLTGKYEEPAPERGAWSPLVDKGETIGAVLRTKDKVSPIFVSTGHRVSLPSAIRLVLECTRRYRLPEPTRQAHLLSNAARKGEL